MSWHSVSLSQKTIKELKKLKKRLEEVKGRKMSMNDVISVLIEKGGDRIVETQT
ncbi:hypothetical protein [Archaeoglobus sp. JdFR-39]|mgnify:CR=1 FL=1|jgi:hypothetical protein|uniref:hypothetical protein n=1 Tax=Archaeoglobus sp. JdFR-39 TaxID=1934996 RepID=UPI0025C47B9B|nr:hypothetical protein [Archaeoglobus sp. JdFR-39]